MPEKQKAVVISKITEFEYKDIPIPSLRPDEVLIRVSVTGLCRTDLKVIERGHRDLVLPRVPGEEIVGTVEQNGGEDSPFALKDRVYVYPGIWCGKCPSCRKGAFNLCQSMKIMGFHRDGGFAQYCIAPVQSLIKIPDSLEDKIAVFSEPLSCCLNALELGKTSRGDHLGVWGAGVAGTLCARAGKARGASVTQIDPDPLRAERSGGCTQLPDNLYFDLAVVATGNPHAYQEALNHLFPRGRLVIFSGLLKEERKIPVDLNDLHYRELQLTGAYGCSFRHGKEALSLLAAEKVIVSDLISHELSLWDLASGLDIVKHKKGMKVLLDPWKERNLTA